MHLCCVECMNVRMLFFRALHSLVILQAFWDWSWQELAQYDLTDMITYVYSLTNSKVFLVGHSQVLLFCIVPSVCFKIIPIPLFGEIADVLYSLYREL